MAGVQTKRKGKSTARRPRRRANNTVSREELLIDGSDFHFRKFVHDSLAFAARLTAVRDGYARLIGVSGPQYTIIISLAHLREKGPVTVSDIASHLHLSGSFVTNECKKLTEYGLISKSENNEDRRRVNLEITDDGWERLLVLETNPGEDGLVKKAKIKTATSVYDRPIHKLCLIATKEELNSMP